MLSPENRRLLLVHAHPDDETITTGGTMARYVAEGAQVALVTCTLGEQGEIIPPELRTLDASEGDQLGGYRAGELAAALDELGIREHAYLGGIGCWRDSGMVGTPAAEHPRAFTGGSSQQQAHQLTQLVAAFEPQVVVSYEADGGYGHPDHIRAHEITMAATARSAGVRRVFHTAMPSGPLAGGVTTLPADDELPFRRPVDGELPSVPDECIATTIDIAAYRDAKIAALRAHRTQVSVPPHAAGQSYYALSNEIAQPVLDAEYFVLARGVPDDAATDLFGGLE